jgi:hypothetical protein
MRRLISILLVLMGMWISTAPLGVGISMAASQDECKGPLARVEPGNPWLLKPGVQAHFLALQCSFHRQPAQKPAQWEVGTCRSCHSGATSADNIPAVVTEDCARCHFAVSPQQANLPCADEWCPVFIRPAFADRGGELAIESYIAGMNRNPDW